MRQIHPTEFGELARTLRMEECGRSSFPEGARVETTALCEADKLRCPRCGAKFHHSEILGGFNFRLCDARVDRGDRCNSWLLITAADLGLALVSVVSDIEKRHIRDGLMEHRRKAS